LRIFSNVVIKAIIFIALQKVLTVAGQFLTL
jgi:hypothetical protein